MDVEHHGVIKDSVQRTEQDVFLIEVFPPQRRAPVAGKDNVVDPFLVVAPVNQVKEQPGILFIKFTVANLINNEAGRPDETIKHLTSREPLQSVRFFYAYIKSAKTMPLGPYKKREGKSSELQIP